MHPRHVLPLLSALALLASPALHAQRPTATFIGNCAFRIDLGDWTLYSDMPYVSGSSGYDAYVLPDGFDQARGTALITQAHPDHFDSTLFRRTRLELIAPWLSPEGMERALEQAQTHGLYVYPIPTPHGDAPHDSYIVAWSGRRLYFTGDTEDPAELLKAANIDVAFVTPWLIDAVNKQGRSIDARTVIVYHHRKGELDGTDVKAPCTGCKLIIPQPGDAITLFR